MEPNPEPKPSPDPIDPSSRPTHCLEDVRVGDYGVQLLVIGSWNDASVQELAKMINQRQTTANRDTAAAAGFGSAYGSGYTLGAPGNGNVRIVRPPAAE
ncbi:hypothetical protein G7Z17_g2463 [Cylindrodendrum hubeiense]|uniref:Uncharacterized protein n=1 Tax=Cylindrodendrum hubeiense TaxID=595255 RepID=A0A9P5LBN0_9HYPO|nr:hypothetical protein G7Z17_g2463 [Cylindrodendrum hubeiense]